MSETRNSAILRLLAVAGRKTSDLTRRVSRKPGLVALLITATLSGRCFREIRRGQSPTRFVVADRRPLKRFVLRQLDNGRPATRKKAEKFLRIAPPEVRRNSAGAAATV